MPGFSPVLMQFTDVVVKSMLFPILLDESVVVPLDSAVFSRRVDCRALSSESSSSWPVPLGAGRCGSFRERVAS